MNSTFDRVLLDRSPDAVILTTPTGEVIYWNNGEESIFGFARSEVAQVDQIIARLMQQGG
jgi:PAS domain S-box-containing protein